MNVRISFLLALMLSTAVAQAAGYSVGADSASGAGVAYAGGAAIADDASTAWFNPAGMMRLEQTRLSLHGHMIFPVAEFDDGGSVLADGTALTGGNGGNGGSLTPVVNIFGVWSLGKDMKFGLAVTSPFGLATEYEHTWVGRYNQIETSLITLNVNPAFAMRLSPKVSVGAGLSLQYADSTLRQAIDFGSVCQGGLGAACGPLFGLSPQASDGSAHLSGDGLAFGYNGGILYEHSERTRLGAHYRSRIDVGVDYDSAFEVPAAARTFLTAAGAPDAFNADVGRTDLLTPALASVSFYHDGQSRWAVMADVTMTFWSRLEEIRIDFDNPMTPPLVQVHQWKDVLRLSAGATYQWKEAIQLRAGVGFDESPIEDEFRGAGIPDSDRVIVAFGGNYRTSEKLSIDFAYHHQFVSDGPVNRTGATGAALIGELNDSLDYLSVGFNWTF